MGYKLLKRIVYSAANMAQSRQAAVTKAAQFRQVVTFW
jgi:hypothetical protein